MLNWQAFWNALDRAAIVAMLAAAAVIIWTSRAPRSQPPSPSTPVASTDPVTLESTLPADLLTDAAVKGEPRAPVTIVEFSDFQCVYCAQYARETHPQLQREFVNSGKVRYAVLNLPIDAIHPHARKAAEAAECTRREGKYWDMYQRLFQHPQVLEQSHLAQYAKELGVDQRRFAACLNGEMTSKLDRDKKLATTLGVSVTPTFLIGTIEGESVLKVRRILRGAMPYSAFKSVLDELLG